MAEPSPLKQQIEAFLQAEPIAVVGASEDPSKFGHRVYAAYLRHGIRAYPVNPRATTILGNPAFPDLASLPEAAGAVSIITPPAVTESIVEQAIAAGVRHLWMQPGAESPGAIQKAVAAGLNVIAGGPCVLVELARR
jgi:predicted CoA-binding protein